MVYRNFIEDLGEGKCLKISTLNHAKFYGPERLRDWVNYNKSIWFLNWRFSSKWLIKFSKTQIYGKIKIWL